MTETTEKLVKPRRKISAETLSKSVEPMDSEILEDSEKENTAKIIAKSKKTKGVIAVDNGGDNTKVFAERMESPTFFKSKKSYGKKKDLLDEIYGETKNESHISYIVEWNDQVYLTNKRTIQGKYDMTSYTDTKANDFFILSILIAIAKHGYDINYVCTSVPYKNWRTEETEAIEEMLLGNHTIIIDKVEYNFEVARVLVTAEAQTAYFYLNPIGQVTLLEIGSRTVGYATNLLEVDSEGNVITDAPIREKSGTIERAGVEIKELDVDEYTPYCSNIYAHMASSIDENDEIIAFGGGVLEKGIRDGLQKVFKNITFAEDPLYTQVRGMLNLAQEYFDLEEDDTE